MQDVITKGTFTEYPSNSMIDYLAIPFAEKNELVVLEAPGLNLKDVAAGKVNVRVLYRNTAYIDSNNRICGEQKRFYDKDWEEDYIDSVFYHYENQLKEVIS